MKVIATFPSGEAFRLSDDEREYHVEFHPRYDRISTHRFVSEKAQAERKGFTAHVFPDGEVVFPYIRSGQVDTEDALAQISRIKSIIIQEDLKAKSEEAKRVNSVKQLYSELEDKCERLEREITEAQRAMKELKALHPDIL